MKRRSVPWKGSKNGESRRIERVKPVGDGFGEIGGEEFAATNLKYANCILFFFKYFNHDVVNRHHFGTRPNML